MDCKTATLVYKTGNPLERIREIFPEAWSFLSAQAWAFVAGKEDEFDAEIKKAILFEGCANGQTPFQFRITHRDDTEQLTKDISELLGDITSRLLLEQHFSQVVGRTIYFSTICCSSHITTDRELTLDEVLPIQRAAVELQ
ncbi:hypothetical protein [Tychonema sp. BBK16]|uniref:hypothetical protein n=1 Tax=Tychonema sp. BBK16 TaxID=2699888 RepID=UPI001F34D2AD|nr:hypothetical protein [Tychonema sp. BBK16]MCF6372900.1 hypothetical protein [Tychonema sp. BBK16]